MDTLWLSCLRGTIRSGIDDDQTWFVRAFEVGPGAMIIGCDNISLCQFIYMLLISFCIHLTATCLILVCEVSVSSKLYVCSVSDWCI